MAVDLILFPCNGNAIEALDCIDPDQYNVIGFVDDSEDKLGTPVFGIQVFPRSFIEENPQAKVLAVPGSPTSFRIREQIINELGVDPSRWATVIHHSASVSSYATVGLNCLIMDGAVVKAASTLGDNVVILPNSVVHHDSVVGKNTLIGAQVGIAGYVSIGHNCYIGSGSRIRDHITIADHCLVGMGSNVVKNIAEGTTVMGNPAKPIA
jgi:sugar O-acyltransferase (sialic acid O-acetyltransferase NeuD family)